MTDYQFLSTVLTVIALCAVAYAACPAIRRRRKREYKRCENCKYYRRVHTNDEVDNYCDAPEVRARYTCVARDIDGGCGPEARRFIAKPQGGNDA